MRKRLTIKCPLVTREGHERADFAVIVRSVTYTHRGSSTPRPSCADSRTHLTHTETTTRNEASLKYAGTIAAPAGTVRVVQEQSPDRSRSSVVGAETCRRLLVGDGWIARMLAEIDPPDAARAMPLLTGLGHQLSAAAVLAGTMPGLALVDDAVKPSSVFVSSPEGIFIGGDPTDGFAAAVRERLAATYVPERDGDLVVSFDHADWERLASAMVPELAPFRVPRRHYLLRMDQPRRRPSPPAGVRIVPIDAALLRHARLPDHVRSWIDGNWGGEANFLARGFGVAAVQDERIVSWSVADCVLADRAEIGIHTVPECRRRGLATQVTAAAVMDAFDRGLAQVGWHCNEDNPGSYRTAEAVGFTLHRRYHYFTYTARGR